MSSATAMVAKPTRALGDVLAMTLDAVAILFTRRFSWREAVQQAWFITRVSLVPTLLLMPGFTLLVIFESNLLLKDLGALDLSSGIAGLASVQQIGPFVTVVAVAGAGGTAICADLGARTIREEIAACRYSVSIRSSGASFLDQVAPVLPRFLGPPNAISSVLGTYRDPVAALLSLYPQAVATLQSVTLPELGTHDVRLSFANADKPAACFKGFLPVDKWPPPFDTTLIDTPLLYCAEDAGDPRAVRGARSILCPQATDRRAPTAALCRRR